MRAFGRGASDKLPASAVDPVVFRRKGARRLFRKDAYAPAAALIGELAAGDELTGITNGQFSLVDMLHHVLTQTGPADVVVATWTMGVYDADKAYTFVQDKLIRRIRFIVDPSMFTRRPELASVLVKGFGVDAFRAVNSHAKFCTVRGASLAVAMRSSMNLNANQRLETFDISCDEAMTAFYETLTDEIFAAVDRDSRTQSREVFESLLGVSAIANPKMKNPFFVTD